MRVSLNWLKEYVDVAAADPQVLAQQFTALGLEIEKIEQPGFFSRMFSGDKKAEAPQYRIHLAASGDQTLVTVLDANGARDNSATAQRLLSVLKDKM